MKAIKKEFGQASYHSDGSLDRSFLAKATFENRVRLDILNGLVHPRVAQDYLSWTNGHHLHPYLLREAALLYETGIYASIDKMIVVSAPRPLRIARVLKRDPHRTEKDVEAILQNQWPEEEKLKRADYIIYNDDQQLVIPQVLELHHTLIALSGN
jgi:dephospho-CoA kinase